jgi:hypothetical protein
MADPKKKGPNVARAQLAPTLLVQLCLTLRDPFGSPIAGMRIKAKQTGKELQGPGGQPLVTSDKGRVDIIDVVPTGSLELVLDPDFVPVDTEDRRSNTKYQYNVITITEMVEYAVTDDSDAKSPVDTKRAFATAFIAPNPFNPVFRFPWQNPLHHTKVEGQDRIYARRVFNLAFTLKSVFDVAPSEVDGLDHSGLVKRLVDLFEQSKATAIAEAAAAAAAAQLPVATDLGTEHEPEKPPPSQPAPLPGAPAAEDPAKAIRKVEIKDETPKPDEPSPPPPKPPPAVPSAATDSASLPRWVWYMIFHHTGLRYSPEVLLPDKFGAHGTYLEPALILRKMRERERDDQYGDAAPAPDAADITEALALAERDKKKAERDLILSSDPKKQKAGISAVFAAIAEREQTKLQKLQGPGALLTGDYFALGLLKAKRLKKHPLLNDGAWAAVTSATPLRNDVQKDDWERLGRGLAVNLSSIFNGKKDQAENDRREQENEKIKKKNEEIRKENEGKPPQARRAQVPLLPLIFPIDPTQWRARRQQTLDTILSTAVCDQTSESAELMRGNTLSGGIPANAARCASLQHFIFANAKFMRRGMHLFYSGFGAAGADQNYPTTSRPWEDGQVHVDRLPQTDKTTRRVLTPIANIAVVKLEDVIDSNHVINMAIARKNDATDRGQKTPLSIVDPSKRFDGVRRMSAASLFNGSDGDAFVKCVDEKAQDPTNAKQTLDVVRLHVLKWTHQEMIVDVRMLKTGGVLVILFATAADPNSSNGTGIRLYNLSANKDPAKNIDATMNIVFGFISPTTNEKTALLDACYLNPTLLRN